MKANKAKGLNFLHLPLTVKYQSSMETKFCQSCGMPLTDPDHFGTNKDESANTDYCIYCFENGAFKQDYTMDEMIAHCAQFIEEFNEDAEYKLTKEEAVTQMRRSFPSLKRWAKGEFQA